MNVQSAWDWSKDKIAPGVIAAVLLAVLAFAIGLFQLPVKIVYLEKQADKISGIETTLAELKRGQQAYEKTADDAAKTVKDFNQEVKNLTANNARLEANITNLSGLSTTVGELRKATDELRLGIGQLSADVKRVSERFPQTRSEVAAVVFLTESNSRLEGNALVADFRYPESLGGRAVREVRARLGSVVPMPGVTSLSSAVDAKPGGFTIRLQAPGGEASALAQFSRKQPVRVELSYVLE
jgi:hypothetical protein